MTERYRFGYGGGTVYESVVSLVRQFRVGDADVVIDIGCGYGAVAEPLRDEGLTYVAFDAEPSGLSDLKSRGFETEQIDLLDLKASMAAVHKRLGGRRLAAVLMIDTLEHLANGPDVLRELSNIAPDQGGVPLVIAVPNVTHIDIGAKLIIGRWDVTETGILDSTHVAFFSSEGLRRMTADAGWVEIGRSDFVLRDSDQHFPLGAATLERGAPLHDLLESVREQAGEGAIVNEFVRVYNPLKRAEAETVDAKAAPFLTVLMRTQGKRHATIQEALLALAAQTSQDFEVLILAHDVAREKLGDLRYLADSFGQDFSDRVRVVSVDGGGRSRPLNVGVELARGQYVAILDDDDVVFGHWVETFSSWASEARGRIIRSVPAEQDVRPMKWPEGREGYAITSRPRCPWPERFDLLDHLAENRTPPCSYAMPRSAFADLGIRFDEGLSIVEDWDVLLRIALLSGVVDSGIVTALWRKWEAGDSSKLIHTDAEWRQARDAVIAKLDRSPLLFPARSLTGLLRLQSRIGALNELQNRSQGDSSDRLESDWDYLIERARVAEESLRAIEVMKNSTSWKLTAPVRAGGWLRRKILNRLGS
jgi:2-polyprenyl-3-methyl-5-hydroxy-6-metoxy-1,4-benzoquinol methylase